MTGFAVETYFAKEAKDWHDCRGKLLDCSYKKYIGDCSAD